MRIRGSIVVERGEPLVAKNVITPREFELRKRNFETADAALKTAISQRDAAQSAIKTAQADVEHDQSVLQELVLVSPRNGRVLYQLLRSGEVVSAGAPIVTILDAGPAEILYSGEDGRARHGLCTHQPRHRLA
jgi:HlyD family secretion protein